MNVCGFADDESDLMFVRVGREKETDFGEGMSVSGSMGERGYVGFNRVSDFCVSYCLEHLVL